MTLDVLAGIACLPSWLSLFLSPEMFVALPILVDNFWVLDLLACAMMTLALLGGTHYTLRAKRDNFEGRPFIISHSWLSKAHPDPDGVRLHELVAEFDRLGASDEDYFFFDFCCMPQHDQEHCDWTEPHELFVYDHDEHIAKPFYDRFQEELENLKVGQQKWQHEKVNDQYGRIGHIVVKARSGNQLPLTKLDDWISADMFPLTVSLENPLPPGHEALRTAEENKYFKVVLGMLNHIYTWTHSRVIVLPNVPENASNSTKYKDRGWTCFELAISSFFRTLCNAEGNHEVLRLLNDLGMPHDALEDFADAFADKKFTSGGDRDKVQRQYEELMGSAIRIGHGYYYD